VEEVSVDFVAGLATGICTTSEFSRITCAGGGGVGMEAVVAETEDSEVIGLDSGDFSLTSAIEVACVFELSSGTSSLTAATEDAGVGSD